MSEQSHEHEAGSTPEQLDPEIFRLFHEISGDEILKSLETIPEDPQVGIRIKLLQEGKEVHLYAALIRRHVKAHVHEYGAEWYRIERGHGEMHTGPVSKHDGKADVDWQEPQLVGPNSEIEIPENIAHCLKSTGGEDDPLVLIFISSPNHLKNTDEGGDRIMVQMPLESESKPAQY